MARPEKWIDQIVFRWDAENASGTTGFGPVAWSGSREQVEAVFRITGAMLRSGGDAGGEETRPALVRVEDAGGRVVLVRRAPVQEAVGRAGTVCHVLAGTSEVLDPDTCLGLHAWDWSGAAEMPLARVRGALDRVPEAGLIRSAVDGQERLTAGLARHRDELAGAVAELLRYPDGRFTLLDRSGGAGACGVLFGLHGIFGKAVPWPWTFATHDTAELPNLRYVFVGRWAGAATRSTDRRRTDPLELLDDRAASVARGLVARHLEGLERGDGAEFEVAEALAGVAAERRAPLLDTATRALLALTPAHPSPPQPPAPRRPAPDRRNAGRPDPYTGTAERPDPHGSGSQPPQTVPTGTGDYGRVREPAQAQAPAPAPYAYASSPGAAVPAGARYGDGYAVPANVSPQAVAPSAGPFASGVPRAAAEWGAPPAKRGVRGRSVRGDAKALRLVIEYPDDPRVPAAVQRIGDDELVETVYSHRLPYRTTSLLLAEAARRLPHWNRDRRREFCTAVLTRELFVTAEAPSDAVRAANAAALYGWAVRPHAREPETEARLAALLPRLGNGPAPAGRAAVARILEEPEPGLPEAVWLALLREAYARPPKAPNTPAPVQAPPPAPAPPAPAPPAPPAPAPVAPPPYQAEPLPRDDRNLVFALIGGLLVVFLLVIVLIAVR